MEAATSRHSIKTAGPLKIAELPLLASVTGNVELSYCRGKVYPDDVSTRPMELPSHTTIGGSLTIGSPAFPGGSLGVELGLDGLVNLGGDLSNGTFSLPNLTAVSGNSTSLDGGLSVGNSLTPPIPNSPLSVATSPTRGPSRGTPTPSRTSSPWEGRSYRTTSVSTPSHWATRISPWAGSRFRATRVNLDWSREHQGRRIGADRSNVQPRALHFDHPHLLNEPSPLDRRLSEPLRQRRLLAPLELLAFTLGACGLSRLDCSTGRSSSESRALAPCDSTRMSTQFRLPTFIS